MTARPFRLKTAFHEKLWGVTALEPWFRPSKEKIGEVWFSNPGAEPLPLLVKMIFTSDRLSVQVHPGDTYALAHEGSRGKTEMWYVLRAESGAQLAAGFREPITRERAREAALSGEIEHLLQWFTVSPGQVYFIPSGVVHALGAGITLCEIQQNNPITYRLYDYGRPRELHLDKALDVARFESHPGPTVPEGSLLFSCRHFTAERLEMSRCRYQPDAARIEVLLFLEGEGEIGADRFAAGEAWCVPPGTKLFTLSADTRVEALRTFVP